MEYWNRGDSEFISDASMAPTHGNDLNITNLLDLSPLASISASENAHNNYNFRSKLSHMENLALSKFYDYEPVSSTIYLELVGFCILYELRNQRK